MEIDPATIPSPERYKLLIGCIVPRPIAFVSTMSPDGRVNLAPFSFFCGVGSDPMTVAFCPVNAPDGSEKDTLRNAKPLAEGGTGEFVVNAAVEAYANEVAGSAEPLPYGESEFELVGLSPVSSVRVRPPRIFQAPWSFECETMQVVRTNPGVAGGGNVVIGRVVHLHVRDDVINARRHVDPEALRAIGRMAGITYCTTRDRFDMPLGRAALIRQDEAAS